MNVKSAFINNCERCLNIFYADNEYFSVTAKMKFSTNGSYCQFDLVTADILHLQQMLKIFHFSLQSVHFN